MASVEEIKAELAIVLEQAKALTDKLSDLDSVNAAAQLSRLDFASLLLAVISLLLVFGGLFAFGFVRGQVSTIAKATAEEIVEHRLTELIGELRDQVDDIRKLRERTDPPSSKPDVKSPEKADPATETSNNGKG